MSFIHLAQFAKRVATRCVVATSLALVSFSAYAATPSLVVSAPADGLVGEQFCADAALSNSGTPGFGPYLQIQTQPDYSLASVSFLGGSLTSTTVGVFGPAPSELVDPISGVTVTGVEGDSLHVVRYPIGSVVAGQPDLTATVCFNLSSAADEDTLDTEAFRFAPGYEFGDTATGDNGSVIGAQIDRDFTPREVIYSLTDATPEGERPPGATHAWNLRAVANIASNRTVNADFNTVSPITLPPNLQFLGPVTVAGAVCNVTTPAAPPPESPGGTITIDCPTATGTLGEDEDIVIEIPVYIVDSLDPLLCDDGAAINTSKHLALQKSAGSAGAPGSSVSYSIAFQVSEFVDGVSTLSLVDTLPDGLTFSGSPTVTYGGSTQAVSHSVANNSPGTGQTTITYDVTATTGTLAAASSGTVNYSVTIDQTYDAVPNAGEPLRARDSLTNSVLGSYDILNGASACDDDSSATIQLPDVSSSKSLQSPAGGFVQPGDSVVWRLRLNIPSGDTQAIEFNDFFPLPIFDVSTIDTTLPLASNTSISLTGNHTIGEPTAIVPIAGENRLQIVWPDVSSTLPQVIEVDVTISVSSEPFANGLELSNVLQAVTNNTVVDNSTGLNIAAITLQEPELEITKTTQAPSTGLEAGDTVTWSILVANVGDAEAYDVLVTDTPDSGFVSCVPVSNSKAGTGDIFGAGFSLTGDLAAGDSLSLEVSCVLDSTVTNNTTYMNTAEVVYAAQPGATSFPAKEDTSNATTTQVDAFKEIVTTSEPGTNDATADTSADPRPVLTGEIIRYRAYAHIPQGTVSNATFRDLLPAGLEYVAGQTFVGLLSDSGTSLTASGLTCASGTAARSGNDSTDLSTLALDCAVSASSGGGSDGADVFFSLGTLANTETDSNEELVVIEFNVRVTGSLSQGTSIQNRMRLQTANGNRTSDRVYAQQQRPTLEIDKSVSPTTVDGDDTVEYLFVIRHATGSSVVAHDLSFNDVVPAGLTYDSGTGVTGPVAASGETCTAARTSFDDANPDTTGIAIGIDALAVGDVCEIRFSATTDSGILPGQTITNTVMLDYTSLPAAGTDPNATGSSPGSEGSYSVDDDADLSIQSVVPQKSIVSSSVAATPDGTADTALDPRPLTIGESVRYRLQVRLPEGDAPGFQITDNLPDGLSYVANSARVAFVFNGGGTITAAPALTCTVGVLNQTGNESGIAGVTPTCGIEPSGGPFATGTDPVWALGDLMNTDMDADQEFVVIEFDALVVNEASNVDGRSLSNDFDVTVDGSDTASTAVVAEVNLPAFGLAKRASTGPQNNGDGTYSLTYTLVVENPGDFALANVQVTDDLDATFGAVAYSVDSLSATGLTVNFPGFDGSGTTALLSGTDSLGAGSSGTITLALTLTPGNNFGDFDNSASASSTLPSGVVISDLSEDGSVPDGNGNGDPGDDSTPTTVTLSEAPEIGLAKRILLGPENNQDGSYTLTYRFVVENSGDVNLSNVQVSDALATVFSGATYTVDALSSADFSVNSPGFDGSADQNLLAAGNSLARGASGEIDLRITVSPGSTLGPYNNTANATATAPSGATPSDQSDDGTDPDGNGSNGPGDDADPTPVTFSESPELGIAKSISSGPTNNGDGSYSLVYRLVVENSGDIEIRNLQIVDVLSTTFSGATGFTVDSLTSSDFTVAFPGYDGLASGSTSLLTGADVLAAGADGEVLLTVTVTPGANLGPYNNSATVNGVTPGGGAVSDQSVAGTDPDANGNSDPSDDTSPTPVSFSQQAILGLAKVVSAGPSNNADGTYSLTYRLFVENSGDVVLNALQVNDDLSATFSGAAGFVVDDVRSSEFSVNFPGFDGSGTTELLGASQSLASLASGSIEIDVTVTPGANLGPYSNSAVAAGTPPTGTPINDTSHAGTVPDGNGDGNPGNDSAPTPVNFVEGLEIGLAKTILGAVTNNGDGTFTLTYRLTAENTGDIQLNALQIDDALSVAFAAATSYVVDAVASSEFTVNPGYDGTNGLLAGTDTLSSGDRGSVDVTVTVTPGSNFGPYQNSATAQGTSPGGVVTTDTSDNGSVVDENGNGNPTDDSDPTPISFDENGGVGLAKALVASPTNNADGTYTLSYRFLIENVGDIRLDNVQVVDDLSAVFAGADGFSVESITSSDLSVNTNFGVAGDSNLLTGADSLAANAAAVVDVTLLVTPGSDLGPYNNTATVNAATPGGAIESDDSDDASVVDEDGDGDPASDSDPTPVTFSEAPQLGLAKELVAPPVNNGDGSYALSYLIRIENSGDVALSGVSIEDNLGAVFAGVTSVSVVGLASDILTVNPGYNGLADTNLLSGADSLSVGSVGSVTLDLLVVPGANFGPYNNSAVGQATSPAGQDLSDTSADGSVPDADGSGDPANDSTPTPVSFQETALLGIAKSAVSPATPNFDGTFSSAITLVVQNLGDVAIDSVVVSDDVASQIAPATVVEIADLLVTGDLSALNLSFDGVAEVNLTDGSESLAVGEQATITFDLVFNPNDNPGPFENVASVVGESPGNPTPGVPNVADDSVNGSVPDANGNADPSDDSSPTPIAFVAGNSCELTMPAELIPGQSFAIDVSDNDQFYDNSVIESFQVSVTNTNSGEIETIQVTETAADSGQFTGVLLTQYSVDAGTNDDGVLFAQHADTIGARFVDRLTETGSVGECSGQGVLLGLATLQGAAWLDADTNDLFGAGEEPLTGWIIRVTGPSGTVEVPVQADGSYTVPDLIPGAYDIELVHPDSGATFGRLEQLDLPPQTTVLDQNLPIDPSGVFYDSVTREPVEGVTALLVDDGGTPLPQACLLAGQQSQITGPDGRYRFDLLLDADPACPSGGTFTLIFTAPDGYNNGYSMLLPPQSGALDPTGQGDPLRVGDSADAPSIAQATDYFVAFTLSNLDPNVVWNHVPLDPQGVGGFSVRLTKDVNRPTTSVGGLVPYRIVLENLSPVTIPGISVVDSLPPGFSYVEGSATLDGEVDQLVVTGVRPVTFAGITLQSGERRTVGYLLRTGAGVTRGEYTNTATPFVGPAQIGNSDSAEVLVVADPDFEETTVTGKVFNDRDADGWQDSSEATRIRVRVELEQPARGKPALLVDANRRSERLKQTLHEGVVVPSLPGRYGLADLSHNNELTVRGHYSAPVKVRRVVVTSAEGTRLEVVGDAVRENHRGAVRAGRNSQHIDVRYRQYPVAGGGTELVVELRNLGFDEPGVPGVRLATVEGLLIETDAYGRYHIAGVDGGFIERGRNFIVKADPVTLPGGTTFVSENPRVKRLSQGLMNEFNFAVQIPEEEPPLQRKTLKIAEVFFETNSADVLPEYQQQLSELVLMLNRGQHLTLRLEALRSPGVDESAAVALAQRRAEALRSVLQELAGRSLTNQLRFDIRSDRSATDLSSVEVRPELHERIVRALGGLVRALIPVAHAEEAACHRQLCNNAGIPIIILEEEADSVYAPSSALQDTGRVDLIGEHSVRLPDGGVIWHTEDPARPEPRLAVQGPSHVAAQDGRFTEDAIVYVHSNYAHYFDRLELLSYVPSDVDRRSPKDRIVLDVSDNKRLFYKLRWPLKGRRVPQGGHLVYSVAALDAQNRADRVVEQRVFGLEVSQSEELAQNDELFSVSANTLSVITVDDGVVVFVPGKEYVESIELRPQFESLKTELAGADKSRLDEVISRWRSVENVRIKVVGHTSSVPIARENRHIFADNYALSRARAKVVADYLAAGLGERVASRMAFGRGPDQPVANNNSALGRELNRRADISLVGTHTLAEPSVHVVNRASGEAAAFKEYRRKMVLQTQVDGVMPDLEAEITQSLLNRNDLVARRIPVYGSLVRVQGSNVGTDHAVWLNGEAIALDQQKRFAVEYVLPVGAHALALDVANPATVRLQRDLNVDVSGRYAFMVGLADFTLSDSSIDGSVEPLSGDDRYAQDMLVEGRLAFYLKGKIRGKYLLTAQLDTEEEEIADLFDDIHKKDPRSLFRRLDPDRYYPVYGDDSTVVADVNTQGRMYVRLDWDTSEAVWGNFETGFTGTEIAQYSRGLYGARVAYDSMAATRTEDSKRHLSGFVSENQTALGHSEFLGTGGSLYYLRHTDILPGSDKLRVEVRDPDTNRVLENRTLNRGLDYEVDEIQGRVILSRPLLPYVQQGAPSLILDGPLGGAISVLVADYEYLPEEFDANQLVYGGRARQWLGDHVAIGATHVEEGRSDEDYSLTGVDVMLRGGSDSWLKLEWATSAATQTSRFFSTDGGLNFANSTPLGTTDRSGDAYNVDLHLNGADVGLTSQWVSNAWYREVDDQFSIARRDDGANTREYGVESQIPLREWRLGVRASHYEIDEQLELNEVSAQLGGKLGKRGELSSEIKYIDEHRTGVSSVSALLLGLQYEHQLSSWLSLYAGGQTVLDDSGSYESNDQLSAGASLALGKRSTATLEYRDGDRGNGALASLEHRLTERFAVYGSATHSTDTTADPFGREDNGASMLDNPGTNFAVGQRWTLNDRTRLFSEQQFSRNSDFSGIGNVFGLDYATRTGWHAGFTLQDGEVVSSLGVVDRQTVTLSAGHQGRKTRLSTRLEFRDDRGAENVEQWLTSNRFEWKLSEAYRLAAKFNYSESDNALDRASDARLIEGSLGLARRPVNGDRFNWLARYTYLQDLQSLGQQGADTDQRSHIVSAEGVFKLNQRLSFGAKAARRVSELRLARNEGPWFDSTANFGAARLRWHRLRKWDAMAEYRWLQLEEAENQRSGWLVTLNRHVARNFKVGVGYNFTDFTDDLTDLDYDHKGWFVNVLGKY